MQQSLIYGSRSLAGQNIVHYYEKHLPKNVPLIKKAWQKLVHTEPIFRTRFQHDGDKYCVVEGEDAVFSWDEITTTDRESYCRQLEDTRFEEEYIDNSFQVIHLAPGGGIIVESTIVWNIHHALIDGYSSVLLLNKLRRLLAGKSFEASPLFVPLIEKVTAFQDNSSMLGGVFWKQLEDRFSITKSRLLLPSPNTPGGQDYTTKDVLLTIPWKTLASYARQMGVTIPTVLYGAWGLTLSKYVGSNDIHFETVLSGRNLPFPEATTVIGPLINTVPFCISLDPSASTSQYLCSIFNHSVQLDSFQWANPISHPEKAFATAMNIRVEEEMLEACPLELLGKPYTRMTSEVSLRVEVHLGEEIQMLYHDDQYYDHDIDTLSRTFASSIELLTIPGLTLRECSDMLISKEMIEQLSTNGNWTSIISSKQAHGQYLYDLFTDSAHSVPHTIAVEKEGVQITYEELDEMTTVIAERLSGVMDIGQVACVHANRSINWIISIYGILKAGGVYCPLDEASPQDVRDQNFSQGQGRIFLIGSESDKALKPRTCEICLCVQEIIEESKSKITSTGASKTIKRTQQALVDPDAAAYICFTSGSSGLPKGVLCTHRSLVAFQKDFTVRLMARPGWRIAQTMSPAFDGSIHEIFSALSYGATLVLRGADLLAHLSIADAAILTPSIAKVLNPVDFKSLHALYLVGEAVPQDVCDKWAAQMAVYNMYGPTEGTCGATIKQLRPGETVTLGQANPSTRIYILDSSQSYVPIGVIGEIYLGGVQVALGYVGRPDETEKRFLPDKLDPESGERMYRTGDHGYWDVNGELRLLGRYDRQIKLRGFRIDLDDLEVRLWDAVPDCTAVAISRRDDYLIAQVQIITLNSQKVKSAIVTKLPAYAIPSHIIPVAAFPQTASGKLDYDAITKTVDAQGRKPETKINGKLGSLVAKTWKQVLGFPTEVDLDEDSNFVNLGGHSLAQLQLSNKLSIELGFSVPLRLIILSPRLNDLITEIEALSSLATSSPLLPPNSLSLSPIEKDWWVTYEACGSSSAFNVSFALELGATVDLTKLTSAWTLVFERHQITRSLYTKNTNNDVLRSYSNCPSMVKRMDKIDVWEEVNRPFDLKEGNLMRVMIMPRLLLFAASHIICDLTTLRIMLKEVSSAYRGDDLETTIQYADYVQRIQPCLPQDLSFWSRNLADPPTPSYRIGNWTRKRTSYSGSSYIQRVPTSLFQEFHDFCISRKVTPHQVALATVALAMQCESDEIDIILGAPFFGRNTADTQDIVGLFLEPLPIRIRHRFEHTACDQPDEAIEKANDTSTFLRTVQKASQDALCHATSWAGILDCLGITQLPPENALLDVMVSYHEGYGDTTISGLDARSLYTWSEGAKFRLMVEFVQANADALIMRLEYSDECFDTESIGEVAQLIVTALECVIQGSGYDVLKKRLGETQERQDIGGDGDGGRGAFFGALLDQI